MESKSVVRIAAFFDRVDLRLGQKEALNIHGTNTVPSMIRRLVDSHVKHWLLEYIYLGTE